MNFSMLFIMRPKQFYDPVTSQLCTRVVSVPDSITHSLSGYLILV